MVTDFLKPRDLRISLCVVYFLSFMQLFSVNCCMNTVSGLLGTVSDTLENTAACICQMSCPVLSQSGRFATLPLVCFVCAGPLLPRFKYLAGYSVNINVFGKNSVKYNGTVFKQIWEFCHTFHFQGLLNFLHSVTSKEKYTLDLFWNLSFLSIKYRNESDSRLHASFKHVSNGPYVWAMCSETGNATETALK